MVAVTAAIIVHGQPPRHGKKNTAVGKLYQVAGIDPDEMSARSEGGFVSGVFVDITAGIAKRESRFALQ